MLQKSSIAIYKQIISYFEFEIVSGRLEAGDRIDSIRNLAVKFKVNPNTVQKALHELERDGLIYTDRTNGKFVTDNLDLIKDLKDKLYHQFTHTVVSQSKQMGLSYREFELILRELWEENDHE